MATHSSTLSWKILWTEESGRLQSMGLQESDMTEQLSTHKHNFQVTVNMCVFLYIWLCKFYLAQCHTVFNIRLHI